MALDRHGHTNTNSSSWEAYKECCHWRKTLGILHSLAVHVPGTHFKYCWVDRGNRGKVSFPRIHRATWLGLEPTTFGPWARRPYPFGHAAPIYSLGKKKERNPFFSDKKRVVPLCTATTRRKRLSKYQTSFAWFYLELQLILLLTEQLTS